MREILSGTRGLAGVALAFVIAWALIAVVLLTGTLVAAQQINRDVKVINPRLHHIDTNTREVVLARRTRRLTAEIRAAAAPLSGQLDQTLSAAGDINTTVHTILGRARAINGTVGLIQGTVLGIGSTVNAILANVQSIHSSVSGIHSSVASVGSDVQSINNDATSIHASADRVLSTARSILGTANQIVPAINGINARAVTIGGVAHGIESDLSAVFTDVGSGNHSGIDAHANAIDCSPLLNTRLFGGPTSGCGK